MVNALCGSALKWEGTYDQMDGWRNMVVPQSFVHPAKMAPLLCQKIFEHLEELNLINQESLVCDFMAGTGTTNIIASLRGYQSVSVELEPKFAKIEAANRARLTQYSGVEPNWRIVQGDSRHLSRILNGGTAITSPPYGLQKAGNTDRNKALRKIPLTYGDDRKYGSSRGQVGKLAVVSPPYLEAQQGGHPTYFYEGKNKGVIERTAYTTGHNVKGNVGKLPSRAAVFSPPYSDITIPSNPRGSYGENYRKGKNAAVLKEEFGEGYNKKNPRNIGNLKVGVLSPPYQDMVSQPKKRSAESVASGWKKAGKRPPPISIGSQIYQHMNYGSKKNVGNAGSETYESAMLQIYSEAHKAGISPLVAVTKNPTRKGRIVRLDLITVGLLRRAGYRIFDYHQAVLFKSHDETSINLDMKVQKKVSHKGRIGFFKQLSLGKGSVAASWEDIIFAR